MGCHAELTITAAENIAVMTVKVDGMGDRWCSHSLLYDPVSPSGCRGRWYLHNVIRLRDAVVVLCDILDGRFSGVNDDGGAVDGPEDCVAICCHWPESDGKVLGLGGKCRAGHILCDFRGSDRISTEGEGIGWSSRSGISHRLTLICEYGASLESGPRLAKAIGVGTEPVVSSCLIGGNDYVVTLADTKLKMSGVVWDDGDEVVCDDLERMAIKVHSHAGIDCGIHKSQTVPFTRLNRHSIISTAPCRVLGSAVDQDVVRCWRAQPSLPVLECYRSGLKCGLVEPVGDWHDPKVLVIVRGSRAVHDDRSDHSVSILMGEVRVIPGRAIFSCLELVRLEITRC